MNIEIRSDSVIIDGYVNAVGRDSKPITTSTGDKFVEMAEPGVFRASLAKYPKVQLLINHNKAKAYASTADGTLTLAEDNIGLRAHAVIMDAAAVAKARAREFRGWSYGMVVHAADKEERANNIPRRHLRDIEMFEVSLIDGSMIPCYAGTSVEYRADGETISETRTFEDGDINITDTERTDIAAFEKLAASLRAECSIADAELRIARMKCGWFP